MTTVNRTRRINREIRHNVYGENARQAMGTLTKNCEIFGITKGDISIVNIIEEVVRQVGKCNVTVITWAAAGYDVSKLKALKDSDFISEINFILDYSAESKLGRDRFKDVRDMFPNSVYLTKIHAKSILIKNDDWNIVIRTSMNLNENKRMENFEISDCEILYSYLNNITQDIISMGSWDSKNFDKLGKDKKYYKYRPKKEKDDDCFSLDLDFDLGLEI